jgi:tetratricopeptide (TPR) repeat protein
MKRFPLFVLSSLSLLLPLSALGAPSCEKFGECIQYTLNHDNPIDRVLYATQALKHWTPDIPERDLLNVLKLRGEALIALHISGEAPDLDPLSHAKSDYERFLKQAPGHWMPLSGLARIAELQGDAAQALQYFATAVKTQQPRAYAARAAFYHRQQRWKEAIADFNQSLRLDERYQKREMGMPTVERAEVHYLRGLAYGQLKQALDERLDFESACKFGHAMACKAIE